MKYATVCSGIEAPTMGWQSLGWEAQFFSEIDAFPSAVLKYRHPNVINYGDMTNFKGWPDVELGLVCAGTPCQSFSIAGLRAGLADPRGNLMLTYLGIIDRYRPPWVVWENVPGVLSIDGGRAFGTFLAGLGELGYGFAYRVLNAQHFGVPQRRRRVFVVGCSRGWHRAAAVLFERESLRRNTPPRAESQQGVASSLTGGVANGGKGRGARSGDAKDSLIVPVANIPGGASQEDWFRTTISTLSEVGGKARPGDNLQSSDYLIPEIANPLTARMHKGVNTTMDEGQTMVAFKPSHFTRGKDGAPSELAPPLSADADRGDQDTLVFNTTQLSHPANRSNPQPGDPCHTLNAGDHPPSIVTSYAVRRLTPRECERLQGFPDDYTDIPWNRKPTSPDGPRYRALGNSMAVPVLRWIGQRITEVENIS